MEELFKYLVLTGSLSPGEGLLLQHLVSRNKTSDLTKRKVKNLLNKSGFAYEDVIHSMKTKELIAKDAKDKKISADWEGIGKLLTKVNGNLRQIAHDLVKFKGLSEQINQTNKKENLNEEVGKPKIITRKHAEKPLTPEKLFSQFSGNNNNRPESKLLEETNALDGIELLERLSQLDLLKIEQKKRSRTIKLRSNGIALRYLFQNKDEINSSHLKFLEESLLKTQGSSWEDYLTIFNNFNNKNQGEIPSWATTLLVVFLNLGVIVKSDKKEGVKFKLITPSIPPTFENDYLEQLIESVSGFIPIYVDRLYDVLSQLSEDNPLTIKELTEKLELSSTTITGILKMLTKFQLVSRSSDNNSSSSKGKKRQGYQLTKKGSELIISGRELFPEGLKKILKTKIIFVETLKYAQTHEPIQFGYMDLVGYFRSSGVSNFNPAKALAVLRLMNQTGYGIKRSEEKSGIFEVIAQ